MKGSLVGASPLGSGSGPLLGGLGVVFLYTACWGRSDMGAAASGELPRVKGGTTADLAAGDLMVTSLAPADSFFVRKKVVISPTL